MRIEEIWVSPSDVEKVLLADQGRLEQHPVMIPHHLSESMKVNRLIYFGAKYELSDQVVDEAALDLFTLVQNNLFEFFIRGFETSLRNDQVLNKISRHIQVSLRQTIFKEQASICLVIFSETLH